jgi:hypothetical protein
MRGHDETVRKASSEETQRAIAADIGFCNQELLVATVPREGESHPREYIIRPPVAQPYTPPGRATRTSIAYDLERNRVVFFKDSWRVNLEGLMKEGDVYAILNKEDVPNVARCSAYGDIDDHITYTHQYVKASWVLKSQVTCGFAPHTHCRLILDDIGERLETFKRSKDAVTAVRAALEGAYLTLPTYL